MKSILFLFNFLICTQINAQITFYFNEKTAPPTDQKAVETLRFFLEKMTGKTTRIAQNNVQPRKGQLAVFIENNEYLSDFDLKMPEKLPIDAFFIESKNNAVLLAGAGEHGLEHAVFSFLETLGCRKFSPRDSILPIFPKDFRWPKIAPKTEIPAFAWREIYFPNAFDADFARWHGLKSRFEKKKAWGLFVHTFEKLIPPSIFFEKNPDWFAFNGAKRVADGQLCLTNEAVKKQLIANLRDSINAHPATLYWSISQNDNFIFCKCDKCQISDRNYGSPSGTILAFVNDVAAAFPQKIISTLAYQYSRAAPKNIRPAQNVNIMFCSIECNRGLPIASDPSSADFRRDFEDWAALTPQMYLWDYVANFQNYQIPFPNYSNIQNNIRYFKQKSPEMIFEQGSGRDRSEWSDLKTYLLAKWLWNPEIPRDSLLNDFLTGIFQAASPYIYSYILSLENRLAAADGQLSIFSSPSFYRNSFLKNKDLDELDAILEGAERAVPPGSTAWERVREARLPIKFARLELGKMREPDFWCEKNGKVAPDTSMATLRVEFMQGCETYGIEHLDEKGTSPRAYNRDLVQFAATGFQKHLAFGQQISLAQPASPKYESGIAAILTDGRIGSADHQFNWIGFEKNDFEATIELTNPHEIRKIETHFLQNQGAWIFFPKNIFIKISENGVDWETIFEEKIDLQPDVQNRIKSVEAVINSPKMAKFVKIIAESIQICPDWHSGNTLPAWLFCDEIIVR